MDDKKYCFFIFNHLSKNTQDITNSILVFFLLLNGVAMMFFYCYLNRFVGIHIIKLFCHKIHDKYKKFKQIEITCNVSKFAIIAGFLL